MIIEAKQFANEIKKFIKKEFTNIRNLSVKTKSDKIFIKWDDTLLEEFATPIESFINEYANTHYINVKEIEFWRNHSLEYTKNNKEWSKEKRMKTIYFENKIDRPEEQTISMVADLANIVYQDGKVNVVFTNSKESNTVTFDYKKSWSHKKYLKMAMDRTGIQPNFDFRYGWDMTAL